MKIQIIKGVYGHTEQGIVVPKSKDSEPFEVDDKKAKELISEGIAKKASELKSEADKPIRYRESLAPVKNVKEKEEGTSTEPQEDENENPDTPENAIEYSMANKKEELLKIAEDLGVDIPDPDNTTKQQIIDLLDEATAGDVPQIGDNDGIIE